MPRNASTTRDEIRAFEEKAATLFAGFATADSISKSGLQTNLSRAGISATVTATGDSVKIEIQLPDTPGLKAGETAEDLTTEAKDRRAADYLQARKAAVWTAVKGMAGSASLSSERAIEALRGLGYGATSLPAVQTSVSGEMARARNDGHDSFSFTLEGEHSKDAVAAKLDEVAKHNPVNQVVLSAFPTAVLSDTKIRGLQVIAKLTWPARSEFHA